MTGDYFKTKTFKMKNSTKSLIAIILALFFTSAQGMAQTVTGYSDMSVMFKADTTTKSVLVSNLFEDRAGDQSPIIGAAGWFDKGRQLQCRSLLAFDYGILPRLIKSDQITSARLILNPVQLENTDANTQNKNSRIMVRRVLQPWEDSLTTWINQPLSNSGGEVKKEVPVKKKDRTVNIDVTKMVKDMFEFGNNGFLICNPDSLETNNSFSQWFASAKNENENIRPVLVINYAVPYSYSPYQNQKMPPLPMTAKDRAELMQIYFRPETGTSGPVKEPVKD